MRGTGIGRVPQTAAAHPEPEEKVREDCPGERGQNALERTGNGERSFRGLLEGSILTG